MLGTRIYHRPVITVDQPEGNALHDITVDCDNPSRSLGRDNSPLVFCSDAFYDPNRSGAPKGRAAKNLQKETTTRLDYLEESVDSFTNHWAVDGALETALLDFVDNARGFIKKKKFVEISSEMTAGACEIYASLGNFETTSPANGDPTAYGDLLGRFLSLAFFTFETAAGGDYCAPDVGLSGISCTPTFSCPTS